MIRAGVAEVKASPKLVHVDNQPAGACMHTMGVQEKYTLAEHPKDPGS